MRSRFLLGLGVCLGTGLPGPAAAEYLVFRDGRSMKVESYRFENGETEVSLPGGGRMRFRSTVVHYVAPDEDLEASPPVRIATLAEAPTSAAWEDIADPRFLAPIRESAARHALDPALVAAVIKVESNYHPGAVSPKGALGLMQLMPATARELGVQDPLDPRANIEGGTAHLKKLLDRYDGDHSLALAAYNAGPRRVDRARGIPAIAETRDYVARVLAWLDRLSG